MSSMALDTPANTALEAEQGDVSVRLVNASVAESGRWILRNISLALPRGTFTRLIGANGAGKSTVLRLMCGLITPTAGQVVSESRGRIGYIGHDSMLYPDLTVTENLEFFARALGVSCWREACEEVLARVGAVSQSRVRVSRLSRGTARRVGIARALVHSPALILADEPYAGLDEGSAHSVRELLQEHNARGATLVVSGHSVDDASRPHERLVILDGGRVTFAGTAAECPPALLKRKGADE